MLYAVCSGVLLLTGHAFLEGGVGDPGLLAPGDQVVDLEALGGLRGLLLEQPVVVRASTECRRGRSGRRLPHGRSCRLGDGSWSEDRDRVVDHLGLALGGQVLDRGCRWSPPAPCRRGTGSPRRRPGRASRHPPWPSPRSRRACNGDRRDRRRSPCSDWLLLRRVPPACPDRGQCDHGRGHEWSTMRLRCSFCRCCLALRLDPVARRLSRAALPISRSPSSSGASSVVILDAVVRLPPGGQPERGVQREPARWRTRRSSAPSTKKPKSRTMSKR